MGLAAAELVARILQLAPPYHPESEKALVLYYEDPNGLIRLTPNWEGFVGYCWMRFNGDGFRDRQFTEVPGKGTVRLAVLGDSYTMGDAVPLEVTYPKQLEDLLAEKGDCEVLNCGVSATNSLNQLAILREVLEKYHPHGIVLGYNINDFADYRETRFDKVRNRGISITVHDDLTVSSSRNFTSFQWVKFYIRERSYLWRWTAAVKERWIGAGFPANGAIDKQSQLKSFNAVAEMNAICNERGIPFLMILIPDVISMSGSIRSMKDYPFATEHRLVIAEMEKRGVACMDLSAAFGDRDPRELVAHRFDHHFNEAGHAIIALAAQSRVESMYSSIKGTLSWQKDDARAK